MSALKQLILREINQRGPMPVDRYMQLCLTHPEYGYYMKQDPFGAGGDFTTAPEISQIFGEMIGIWAITRWERAKQPQECAVVELGPGRGTLMVDFLRAIRNVPKFTPEIHMVEISPYLREMQRRKLQNHTVNWHDEFPKLNIPTIVIANEFFDALPIKQFVGEKERKIIETKGELAFNLKVKSGIVKETCLSGIALMEKITANPHVIAGIIIDYGYQQSQGIDTLQAVKKHKYHDVLANPGEADLTAHVDFNALSRAAKKPCRFYSQSEFLLAHGAVPRAKVLNKEKDLLRLTDPKQMGELFKVLCF